MVMAVYFNKSMFEAGESDGFYSQIAYAYSTLFSVPDHPMYFVHLLRLLVAFPFYLIYINDLPAYLEGGVLLIYLFPILIFKRSVSYYLCGFIFLTAPWFFSFRSILVMCGMFYLYMCFIDNRRSYFLYSFSGILASLSSGVLLPWIFINFMLIKEVHRKFKYLLLVFVIVLIGFVMSAAHKIQHFFVESGVSHDESFLNNNTFYVSYIEGDYKRLIVYVTLSIGIWFLLIGSLSLRRVDKVFILFMLAAFPTIMFEGIGLVSFIFILLVGAINGLPRKGEGIAL
jgi:hypothetical protein